MNASEGSVDYQQVLGIISVIQLTNICETSIATLIIGAAYEVSTKSKNAKLMPYVEVKYKFIRAKQDITLFEFDCVTRPLCVISQRPIRSMSRQERADISVIRKLRMWCFDLAFVDRTSWEDFNYHFNKLSKDDSDEVNEFNPFDFLMTTEQLHTYSIRRSRQNERITDQEVDED